jgi:hypothetical protein
VLEMTTVTETKWCLDLLRVVESRGMNGASSALLEHYAKTHHGANAFAPTFHYLLSSGFIHGRDVIHSNPRGLVILAFFLTEAGRNALAGNKDYQP